jgi:hypothetical protein
MQMLVGHRLPADLMSDLALQRVLRYDSVRELIPSSLREHNKCPWRFAAGSESATSMDVLPTDRYRSVLATTHASKKSTASRELLDSYVLNLRHVHKNMLELCRRHLHRLGLNAGHPRERVAEQTALNPQLLSPVGNEQGSILVEEALVA